MALIEVKITAEDSRQFAAIIAALAAVHNLTMPDMRREPTTAPEPESSAPEAEPSTEPEAKPARRKRRSKAEIEAEKAADAAAAEQKTPEGPTETPEPEAPTRQDVEKAMRALLEAGPMGGDQMVGLLVELDAKNDAGDAKISALAEDRYAEAIEKATAMAAEVKKGAGDAAKVLE
jgi:hypothetical protein